MSREERYLQDSFGLRLFRSLCPADRGLLLEFAETWLAIRDEEGRSWRFYSALKRARSLAITGGAP